MRKNPLIKEIEKELFGLRLVVMVYERGNIDLDFRGQLDRFEDVWDLQNLASLLDSIADEIIEAQENSDLTSDLDGNEF